VEALKRVWLIFNLKTLGIAGLAALSTWLSFHYNVTADFPLTLITTAIVFPLVFSIGGAYKRREEALDQYGSIKAHGRAIYFAARDWLAEGNDPAKERVRDLMGQLLRECRTLFTGKLKDLPANEKHVYATFSELSSFIKTDLRGRGLASGEVSRCNQYLSKMILAFENVKHIFQYRTPRSLRAYSDVFIVVLPILYGPYFAHLALEFQQGLTYLMPVLFSVILVSLDNIQMHLENPFDQIGDDDVLINAEKFVAGLEL